MAMKVAGTGGVRALYSSVSSSFPNSELPLPSTKLFVSGLSKHTTSEGLRKAFVMFGEIVYAKVMTDRVSGFSKGFGFVKYTTIKDAEAGIKGMDGQFLDGWVISAEYSRPRQPPPPLENNYTTPYACQ